MDRNANVFDGSFLEDAVGTTLSSVPNAEGTPPDVFMASFAADGLIAGRGPSAATPTTSRAVAVAAEGHLLFVGGFRGAVDFDRGLRQQRRPERLSARRALRREGRCPLPSGSPLRSHCIA